MSVPANFLDQLMDEMVSVEKESVKQHGFWYHLFVSKVFALLVAGMFYVNMTVRKEWSFYLGIYGTVMVSYLLMKMILSFFYKPYKEDVEPGLKVSVVIPSYNEKPESVIGVVKSLLAQDYPVHEIFFVDDGSPDPSAYEAVKQLADEVNKLREVQKEVAATKEQNGDKNALRSWPKIIVHRLEKNQGKRHAQAWAFERATGDFIMTVDSDGYIYPDAVRELLKPFKDQKVMAVTGHINARNRSENLLTRLLDMRYDNAFRVERAAQSVTNSVLVCSGPLSMYRREVIMNNFDDYVNQTFLGEKVQFGDDRRLTNYALMMGKTKYQSTARCVTDVPSSFRKFVKQQIRWNKSFFRETLYAFKVGLRRPIVFFWAFLELFLWITYAISLAFTVFYKAIKVGWTMLVYYLAYIALSAFARNVHYISKRPHIYVMAPLYGLLHLIVLFPIRFYALMTLKQTKWGTR